MCISCFCLQWKQKVPTHHLWCFPCIASRYTHDFVMWQDHLQNHLLSHTLLCLALRGNVINVSIVTGSVAKTFLAKGKQGSLIPASKDTASLIPWFFVISIDRCKKDPVFLDTGSLMVQVYVTASCYWTATFTQKTTYAYIWQPSFYRSIYCSLYRNSGRSTWLRAL